MIADVVKARRNLASIAKLEARVVRLVARIAKAHASDREFAHLSCFKYNNQERQLDDAKDALQTQIARLSKDVDSLCKGLEGRLGLTAHHQELINRLVYFKPSPLDLSLADTAVTKVFTAPDGTHRASSASSFAVDPSTCGGPHLLPVVDMQNMGAIVSPSARVTIENNTMTQAVCDSENFVTHGLTAREAHSGRDEDTHKARAAMLTAYHDTPRDHKKPRVFRSLVQTISHRTVGTQLNPTFLAPDLQLVAATYELLCQSEGTQGALKCMRALATHMEAAAHEMTKNVAKKGDYAYYTLRDAAQADQRCDQPRVKRPRAAPAAPEAPCEDTVDESMCVD